MEGMIDCKKARENLEGNRDVLYLDFSGGAIVGYALQVTCMAGYNLSKWVQYTLCKWCFNSLDFKTLVCNDSSKQRNKQLLLNAFGNCQGTNALF